LNRNPCDFYPSVWRDFFLHHPGTAASSKQQVELYPSLLYQHKLLSVLTCFFKEICGRHTLIWEYVLSLSAVLEISKSRRLSVSGCF
jgi:hypothetical protein